jgi:hypothetical protein
LRTVTRRQSIGATLRDLISHLPFTRSSSSMLRPTPATRGGVSRPAAATQRDVVRVDARVILVGKHQLVVRRGVIHRRPWDGLLCVGLRLAHTRDHLLQRFASFGGVRVSTPAQAEPR